MAESFNLKLNSVAQKFSHYFYGKTFPIQVALLVLLGNISQQALVSLAFLSILASFVFLFFKNVAPIFPMLFLVVMSFADFTIMNQPLPYVILSPAILTFVARFFIFPIKFKKPTMMVYALLGVSLAYILAGVLRPGNDIKFGLAQVISFGPLMIVIYLFFSYNINKNNHFCVKKYLCFSLMVSAIAMILQVIHVRYVVKSPTWGNLGWINVNGVASFILLAIPACCYLIIKSRKLLPYILCLLFLYAGILITSSDAALGVVTVYTPFLLLYTYRNIYRTKRKLFTYSMMLIIIAFATAIIVLISIYGFQGTLDLLQINISSSGRNPIYQKAIELFKENIFFGYGFQFFDDSILHMPSHVDPLIIFNFHSTLLHIMATMGLLGVLAYAFYFFVRFFILMKKYSPFTMTMLTAFIMFESQCMVDLGEFNAIPLMSAVTVIITVVEWATKKENATSALPLTINKRNGYNF